MIAIKLTKKQKYLLHALLTTAVLYFFTRLLPDVNYIFIGILVVLIIGGGYLVHRPNSNILNILITSIVHVALVAGFVLSIIFFPSLSDVFRLAALIVFTGLFYLISLVNNVFLVVASREEPIPLYRVAVTWSKILIATVSIPLFAGVFKISINSFVETGAVALISALFYSYLVWFLKPNPDVKKYRVGEILTILALGTFIVPAASLSVSFIPTETFLRALYVSSILIFGISYIEAHLRNVITKKLMSEHIALSIIFLILLFIFKP
jgi:hypothetical protein